MEKRTATSMVFAEMRERKRRFVSLYCRSRVLEPQIGVKLEMSVKMPEKTHVEILMMSFFRCSLEECFLLTHLLLKYMYNDKEKGVNIICVE